MRGASFYLVWAFNALSLSLISPNLYAGKSVCEDPLIQLSKGFVQQALHSTQAAEVTTAFEEAKARQALTISQARESQGIARKTLLQHLGQSNRLIYAFLNEWEGFHFVQILKASPLTMIDSEGKSLPVWAYLNTQYKTVFAKSFPVGIKTRFEGVQLSGQQDLEIDSLDYDLNDLDLERAQRARFFLGLFSQYLSLHAADPKSALYRASVDILTDLYTAAERTSIRMKDWRSAEVSVPRDSRLFGTWDYEDYHEYSDSRLRSLLELIQQGYAEEQAQSKNGLTVDDDLLQDHVEEPSDMTVQEEYLRQSDFDTYLDTFLAGAIESLDRIDFYRALPLGQNARGLNLVQQLQLSPFAAQAARVPPLSFLSQSLLPKEPPPTSPQ